MSGSRTSRSTATSARLVRGQGLRVSLFLNHACNLRCSYCYNGEHFARAMPFDVARRGVDLSFDLGRHQRRVSFFGGEPLLEMDLLREVVAYGRAEAARRESSQGFLVVTNATLLDQEKLTWFLEHRVVIASSLDGDRAAHDATRRRADGGSSHEQVVRNLRPLLEACPDTKIIAVIDPLNVDHLADSFSFLLSIGARNLSMNVNYEGDWGEQERDRFRVALRALGDRYIEAWRQGLPFSLNLFDSKIVTHLKGGFSIRDRCDFGCEELAVAPSGRLYPCDRLVGQDDRDDVVIGDVWRGIDTVRRDALIEAKNSPAQDCGRCTFVSRCMFWCGCINRAMTGSVGEVSGLLCWFEQRIIEEADRCGEILYREQTPAFMARFYLPRLQGRREP